MSEINFEKDIEASDDELKQIATLALQQLLWQRRVDDLTAQLEEAAKQLDNVQRHLLPDMMRQVGLESFKLTSGEKVDVRRVIKASIKRENQLEAFSWLRAHGHGSLIKNEVTAMFGREGDEVAKKLYAELRKKGYDVDQKESVNSNTLSAFVKEQLTQGQELPMDLLGVFEYYEAKIK